MAVTSPFNALIRESPVRAAVLVGGVSYGAYVISLPLLGSVSLYGYLALALCTVFLFRPPGADEPTLYELFLESGVVPKTSYRDQLIVAVFGLGTLLVFPFAELYVGIFSLYAYYHMGYPESREEIVSKIQSTTPEDASESKPTPEDASESAPVSESSGASGIKLKPEDRVDVLKYSQSDGDTYRLVKSSQTDTVVEALISEARRGRKRTNVLVGVVGFALSFVAILVTDVSLGQMFPKLVAQYILPIGVGTASYLVAKSVNPSDTEYASRSSVIKEFTSVPSVEARSLRYEVAVRQYPEADQSGLTES